MYRLSIILYILLLSYYQYICSSNFLVISTLSRTPPPKKEKKSHDLIFFCGIQGVHCNRNSLLHCFYSTGRSIAHTLLLHFTFFIFYFIQILKAREVLLQSSPTKKRLGPDDGSSQNWNVASTKGDNSGMSEAPSLEEATSVPMNVVEADKHPISVAEVEIIDKSVVEEELVVKNETKSIPSDSEKANLHITSDDDDKEVEDWLKDVAPVSSKTGNVNSAGQEEDISFSDLEDEEDD